MRMIEHYRSWLENKPEDRLAMYGLALELKKAGRLDEAVQAFEALLAVHPQSGAGWFQFGQLFEEAGDEDQALLTWRRGLERLQGSAEAEAQRSIREIEAAIDLLA